MLRIFCKKTAISTVAMLIKHIEKVSYIKKDSSVIVLF